MCKAEALRALWAAYLAFISAPGADYAFEYMAYDEARAALFSDASGPAGVLRSYTDTSWE
jgi:hypothetical protein